MQIPEQVIYGVLFSMFSGIILYILKEQKETKAQMEANQKEIKDKQEAQEIQLLKLEHNYKERFSNISLQISQLDGNIKTEMKDVRHAVSHELQRIEGRAEQQVDVLERIEKRLEEQDKRIEKFYEKNPQLLKV